MAQKFSLAARSALQASITSTATSLSIELSRADLFPVADTGTSAAGTAGKDWFKAVLEDANHNIEVVYVRTRESGSATFGNVLRGQEGTTARAYIAGSVVGLRHTATDLAEAISLASSATSVGKNLLSAQTQELARSAIGAAESFAAGTRMPFAQAAAPTGWTQDTTDNATNRMLRVVNTVGNGIGGSASPILMNVVPAHTHSGTTSGMNANNPHTHTDSGHAHSDGAPAGGQNIGSASPPGIATYGTTATAYANITSTDINHGHSFTTDNGSSPTNWTPRYIDMIICSKN